MYRTFHFKHYFPLTNFLFQSLIIRKNSRIGRRRTLTEPTKIVHFHETRDVERTKVIELGNKHAWLHSNLK
jgi:hypothetical protein